MSIEQVDTLSGQNGLRSLTGMSANEVRFMKGRDAAGDPGAGIYEWAQVFDEDNDSTVIMPDGWSSSSSGRWIRQLDVRGPVHAEWFGAKGDGSTDDSAAIQACLNEFGRVRLLARTYVIESEIVLKAGDVVEGQGMDQTVVKNLTTATDSLTTAFIHSGSNWAHNAVIRDLTINCGFASTADKESARQAIALKGEAILVERVKAVDFSTGDGGQRCEVITIGNDGNTTKMGTIQDCVITEAGDNSTASSPAAIRCLVLNGQTNPLGSWLGEGGRVTRNRIHDLAFTGASAGSQRCPLQGICVGRSRGVEVADNEVVNFDGQAVCLTSDIYPAVDGDKDCVIRNNRLISVNTGVYLAVVIEGNVQHIHPTVEENLILVGKAPGSHTLQNELRGVHAFVDDNMAGNSLLSDLYVQRNFVQGDKDQASNKIPIGVYLELRSTGMFSNVHVEDNLIETPEAVTGQLNQPYENAVVFYDQAHYEPTEVHVHGNRNVSGTDLRLKIRGSTQSLWGPHSTRLARFKAPAYDGRVGLVSEEFIGQATAFALGWTASTVGDATVGAAAGEAEHPGIASLQVQTSSSSSSALAWLKYGANGILLGTTLGQVAYFGVIRTGISELIGH